MFRATNVSLTLKPTIFLMD